MILTVKMFTWLSLSAWKSARLFVQDWRLWWTDTSNVLAPLSILRAGKASSGLEKFLNSSTSFWASSSHIFFLPGATTCLEDNFPGHLSIGQVNFKIYLSRKKIYLYCIVLHFIFTPSYIDNTSVVQYELVQGCLNYVYIIARKKFRMEKGTY